MTLRVWVKGKKRGGEFMKSESSGAVVKATPRQLAGIVAAVIVLVGMHFVPTTEMMPLAARNTLGVLIAVIILLVCETFPFGITCLTAISLLYFFKCTGSVPEALTGFTNATLFFVLASFGISEALTAVPVSTRLLLVLMKKFGQNTNRLLFAVMMVTAVLSSVISNVAAAAVFIPIVQKLLEVYDDEEERNRTGRAFMIALPIASMIGGMMTPAGSSINMLAISMLEKYAGTTITFVQWMCLGIPLTVVLLPVAWMLFIKIYKPAPLSQKKISSYLDEENKILPPKMTVKEKYVLFILLIMLVLWILSSWISVLQITAVALIGLMLYFVPGKMRILSWKQFQHCVSLEAFILMGTMISIGNVITSSGLSEWLGNVLFPANFAASGLLAIGFVCLLTFVLLVIIPVAPALVAMLSGPLVAFCVRIGVSPALAMAAFGLCAANCYLLPLDTVPLMTYATGYYKMFDMPKATVWIQLAMIVICSLWLMLMGTVLGL